MPFGLFSAHKSRAGARDNYPFDYDASERFVRPKTGLDVFWGPNNYDSFAKLGNMSPLCPQMDALVWAQGWGKDPFGPIMSALPVNLQWQITVPGLNKQEPQS